MSRPLPEVTTVIKHYTGGRYSVTRQADDEGCSCNGCDHGWDSDSRGLRPLAITNGRDRSHSSPKGDDGWRNPTPYWGWKWKDIDVLYSVGLPRVAYLDSEGKIRGVEGVVGAITALYASTRSWDLNMSQVSALPLFPDLRAEALTAALAELGSATAELGVELKEARKTADYLASKIVDLANFASDIAHRRVPRAVKRARGRHMGGFGSWAAKSLPERWMEYRYAATPLILGVQDAIELLDSRYYGSRPMLITVRKKATDVKQWGPWTEFAASPWPVTRTYESFKIRSAYVVLTMAIKFDILSSLNDAGVANPPSVIWESIPFSWMVDWVVNLGDYFNAQFAKQTLAFKGGTCTHHYTSKVTCSGAFTPQPWDFQPPVVLCEPPSMRPAYVGGTSFVREVLDNSIQPSVHFERDPLNLTRVLDAVSLLASSLTGKKRPSWDRRLRL